MVPKVPEVACRPQQRGVTLIELMIAMALGLVIVLAASTAFLAGKKLFNTEADVQAVQDSLRFTRHVVQGLIRQAGYADYAPDQRATQRCWQAPTVRSISMSWAPATPRSPRQATASV